VNSEQWSVTPRRFGRDSYIDCAPVEGNYLQGLAVQAWSASRFVDYGFPDECITYALAREKRERALWKGEGVDVPI
jgi:hypothetical protein